MKQEGLKKPFSEELFREINNSILGEGLTESTLSITPDSTRFIVNAKYLGSYEELQVHIMVIEHSSTEDARVGVSLDIFKLMKKYSFQNAVVAAYSIHSKSWRYSLVTSSLEINNKGNIIKKFSNPRRYSFVLGPNQKVLTPFKQLIQLGEVSDIDGLSKRFSLEVVNNDFYKDLAELYDKFVGTKDIQPILRYPGTNEASHQFAVRLIGRIVFCWFLREKKSINMKPLVSYDLLSRSAADQSDYYHKILTPLFFEVLNKPIDRRAEIFRKDAFGDVPYLNGGLFAQQPEDYYKFNKELEISVPDNKLDIPDDWVRCLLDLLETYNFTVDENTSVDIDLSIDPEMLGRIFENLLARINPETGESVRKSTGSFYTPREIVEYMVDESLIAYLEGKTNVSGTKIRALVSYSLDDDNANVLNQDDKELVLNALSEVKILDPACGSGAFPIGSLQKIVYILQQIDPKSELWLDIQLKGAPAELRRQLKEQSYDYVRKIGVIRKSIFGVDIQPIAIEIARLRCFLTLIVDENIDDNAKNRGVKILPNLDFKFVIANTLVNAPSGSSEMLTLFRSFEEELSEVVDDYFSAEGVERSDLSHKIRDLIDTKVNENKAYVLNNHGIIKDNRFTEAYNKHNAKQNKMLLLEAAQWDSYKNIFSHKAIDFYETKYFFPSATSGFDIVIGNPPYISALSAKKIISSDVRTEYKKTYKSAKGAYDMYLLFFERGLALLNHTGLLCYITPTKYVSAKYAEAFRSEIGLDKIQKIAHFSNNRVFDSAGVSTLVSLFGHNGLSHEITTETYSSSDFTNKITFTNSRESLRTFPDKLWGHLITGHYDILDKIYTSSDLMADIADVNGSSTAAEADDYSKLISGVKTDNSLKIVNTGTIGYFNSYWGVKAYSNKRTQILDPYLNLSQVGERRQLMYRSPKIIISKLAKNLTTMADLKGEYASTNTTFIYGIDSPDSLLVLTAILNSNLMNFVYKTVFSGLNLLGSFQFQAPQTRLLPIVKHFSDMPEYEEILKLTKTIISVDNPYLSIKNTLDSYIYKLYSLTEQEIETVESIIN